MTFRYCPYFCEENIWHLASEASVGVPLDERRVVFISNAARQVAMHHQRAGRGRPMVWDYHVVLLAGGLIWDLETTLDLPLSLDLWVMKSFPVGIAARAPRFRVIDAPAYLSTFASDRSHMLGPTGLPLKPFPSWPRIGEGMNLMRFVDLETPFLGEVLDLDALRRAAGGSA